MAEGAVVTLEEQNIPSLGRGCYCNPKVINVGENQALGNVRMEGGNVDNEQEKGNPNPLLYLLSLHKTLLIPKEPSRIHQFIQDHSRTWIGNLTN